MRTSEAGRVVAWFSRCRHRSRVDINYCDLCRRFWPMTRPAGWSLSSWFSVVGCGEVVAVAWRIVELVAGCRRAGDQWHAKQFTEL